MYTIELVHWAQVMRHTNVSVFVSLDRIESEENIEHNLLNMSAVRVVVWAHLVPKTTAFWFVTLWFIT